MEPEGSPFCSLPFPAFETSGCDWTGPSVGARSRYAASGQDGISKWVLSAGHEKKGLNTRARGKAASLERWQKQSQNKDANKLDCSILSNTINVLLVDFCTKLDSSLAEAGPVLIDFDAEYCWRVIIHLGMICVSVLFSLTVFHIFPTLMHESPVKCSSCWRRRITWLQISYIRAGWREGDEREQRSTILAISKAFGNKIRVLELKGKTRTNNI